MERPCSTRGYVGALCRFVVVAVALTAGSTVAFAQQVNNGGREGNDGDGGSATGSHTLDPGFASP
jgi:hypothetical protein